MYSSSHIIITQRIPIKRGMLHKSISKAADAGYNAIMQSVNKINARGSPVRQMFQKYTKYILCNITVNIS